MNGDGGCRLYSMAQVVWLVRRVGGRLALSLLSFIEWLGWMLCHGAGLCHAR